MSAVPAPVVILISGRGSNLRAIVDAVRAGRLSIDIRLVVSSNPDATGLKVAHDASLPAAVIDHRDFRDRPGFDAALMAAIDRHRPRLVILAGFMRILGTEFIRQYDGRLINIHPSLLPAFTGLNTHARALQAGVTQHGASVHFVTNDLDGGPVIAQATVPVEAGDNAETLGARVLHEEHRLYPLAIQWFVEGRLSVRDGRVLLDHAVRPEQGMVTPGPAKQESGK